MGLDIIDLREKIDSIDDELVRLFHERMFISGDIAQYKMRNGLEIYDPEREKIKLADVLNKSDPVLHDYVKALYSRIFELSRMYQTSRGRS